MLCNAVSPQILLCNAVSPQSMLCDALSPQSMLCDAFSPQTLAKLVRNQLSDSLVDFRSPGWHRQMIRAHKWLRMASTQWATQFGQMSIGMEVSYFSPSPKVQERGRERERKREREEERERGVGRGRETGTRERECARERRHHSRQPLSEKNIENYRDTPRVKAAWRVTVAYNEHIQSQSVMETTVSV